MRPIASWSSRNAINRCICRIFGVSRGSVSDTNSQKKWIMSTVVLPAGGGSRVDLGGVADHQRTLLDEMCIVVDEQDNPLRADSKLNCHRVTDGNQVLLHRAFSVFLFNSRDELLLQRRSNDKVTFPGQWGNTCCSHPLYTPDEMDTADDVGVKRAAIRRLNIELGIPVGALKPQDITVVGRILYHAISAGSVWGEHELDYMLFVKKDVPVSPNPHEIQQIKYVAKNELKKTLDELNKSDGLCPWLEMVGRKLLPNWWDHLHQLDKIKNRNIVRFVDT